MSHAAQAPRIDLRPARQVIESPHAVPDEVARRAPAHEERPDVEKGVLRRALGERPPRGAHRLVPLPLSDGIEGERRQPVLRQENAGPLVLVGRLRIPVVAHGEEDPRERAPSRGEIEIGRHVMARERLVDDLLDAVAVALQDASDLRVERGPLGKAAQRGEEGLAELLLPLLHVTRGPKRLERLQAGLEMGPALGFEVPVEHLPRLVFGLEDLLGPKEREEQAHGFASRTRFFSAPAALYASRAFA